MNTHLTHWRSPFLCLLFATAHLTVVFILTAQGLCITEVPVKAIRKNTSIKEHKHRGKQLVVYISMRDYCYVTVFLYVYLRQCVIEVFCSTSTDKSKKSSSLLLTCKNKRACEFTKQLRKKRTHLFRNCDLATHRDNISHQASSRGRELAGSHFYKDVYHARWWPLSMNSFSWRMGCTLLTWLSPVVLHLLQKDMSEDVLEHRCVTAC